MVSERLYAPEFQLITLITGFWIKISKIVWIYKIRWSVKDNSDREGLEEILGSFRWLINLWFILLTSITLLYVKLTLSHNQTRWATFVIRVLCHITGIVRVDGVIYSTGPIFASGHELCCHHVFYMCAFRMSNMRGMDTLHSNGACPRLDAVHAAA
jgi:hypothetical protein